MCVCVYYICVCIYIYIHTPIDIWTSLVAQVVKNPPAMWETWVRSLGWKDPLEKGMAAHSSILENSMDCTVHGVASDMKERFSLHRYIAYISSICLFVYHLSSIYVERECKQVKFYWSPLEVDRTLPY